MPIKINNSADGGLEIELYDVVGYWGTDAKSFRERVNGAKGKAISLRINSPGGNVIEGNAIYNLLKDHGNVVAHIDGMAASMASVIAMAAKEVIMAPNALMMIHNPTTVAEGESEDLRKTAEVMDKMKDGIVAAYVQKTGKTKAKISALMDATTWMNAEEAVEAGFADSIKKESKGTKNSVDTMAFAAYYPEKQFPASASAKAEPQPKQNTMTTEEIQNLQNKVTSLEAEKGNAAKALADAQAKATTDATNAAKSAEKARKDGILALQAKYNKNGDLNDIAVTALAGEVTPEAFKDQVLDVVAARATTKAIKPSGSAQTAKDEGDEGDDEFEKFQKEYAAAAIKGPQARRDFTAKNKVLVAKYLNRIAQ